MLMLSPGLVFSLLAVLFLYVVLKGFVNKWHNVREARKRHCLPPPSAPDRGLWGINTLRESVKATKDEWGPQWMHNAINEVGKDVHTIRAPIFDYELLVTRDVENAKAIFNSQAADFDIGPHRERTFKSAFGLGVMTSRGKDWKHSRGLIRPQFARDNIANLPMFEKHVQSLFKRLAVGRDSWTGSIDMQPLFQNLTLDLSTDFLVGQSVYSQDHEARAKLPLANDKNGPDVANFGHHLDQVKQILDRRGALAKYSWLVRSTEYSQHCAELRAFVDYFVHKKLAQSDEEKSSASADGKFVLLDALAAESQDPVELRNEMLNVLHASRDTTAALMGWVVYFLVRHQDVLGELRKEVADHFPAGTAEEITFSNLQSLAYLTRVVNETIRVVGIVPMNERAALRDTTLPRGGGPDGQSPVFVPKGRQILIPTYSMQHREDIWGEDHDEFKPERWENRKFGFEFIPFGGGVRQCLGQQFARSETMYVIVRLLQKFDKMENTEAPGQRMKFHHSIENKSGTGVHVRFHAVDAGSGEAK